jgi:outer membrane protein
VKFRSILITAVIALPLAAQTAPKPAPAAAPAATKIAIIAFQQAVLTTQEGQAAASGLKAKYDPKKADLEKRQADLQAIQAKLEKGGDTLAADLRAKMQNDLTVGGRNLNHDAEDLNTSVQEDESKIMQGMAAKMGDIIKNYAAQNGYSIVLDVSSQTTPVLWATPSVNITADIIKLYDQAHPAKSAGTPAPAPSAPAKK